jgi:hypothetical protein
MVRDQAAVDSVQHAIGLVTATYSMCTPYDFTLLRETLATHFQDKKVKVSLFLQDGIQKDDGTFAFDTRGPPPPNAEPAGEIRYADGTTQIIDVPTREHAGQGRAGMVLGGNMYAKDRPPPPAPAPAPASAVGGGAAAGRAAPGDPSAVRGNSTYRYKIASGLACIRTVRTCHSGWNCDLTLCSAVLCSSRPTLFLLYCFVWVRVCACVPDGAEAECTCSEGHRNPGDDFPR